MRKVILIGMAIAVAAFASPLVAGASASNWKSHGVEITESHNIPMQGTLSTTGEAGGLTCGSVKAELRLEPGSAGKVTALEIPTSYCHGTGGMAGCAVTSITVENIPWGIHDLATKISVSGTSITFTYTGFLCPRIINYSGEGMTLTPDNMSQIHSLTVSGLLQATYPSGSNISISGSLSPVNASDSGLYGL